MTTNVHSRLPGEEIHRPFRQVFATPTDLLLDSTVYTSNDLYKMAYVESSEKLYVLTSFSPTTWSEVSGSGGGSSGFKLVKTFYITTPDKVEASTTSPTPFSTKITVPGNIISTGDSFSFTAFYNTYNNTGSPVNYDVSLGFGGVTTTLKSTSSTGTGDNLVIIGPGGFNGVFPAAGASASAAGIGIVSDDGSFGTIGFAPFTFDSTSNFDFEIYITWSSTATPSSDLYAQLYLLELKIFTAV